MSKLIGLLVILVVAWITSPALSAELTYVEIHDLAKRSHGLVGQRITTHGCLTINTHGDFIEPCGGANWRELILIFDPTYIVAPTAFRNLHIDYASQVEGDFFGVLVERAIEWPAPGKRVFLRLDSIANATRHEP